MKSGGFYADFMWISLKSGRFRVKSTWKPYKSKIQEKLQFHGVQWEDYVS